MSPWWEGGVWGVACEVVMSCDIVIAAEGATFAIMAAKPDVPYDLEGMLSFIRAVGLRIMREMLLRAPPISADRALHLGIVNQVAPLSVWNLRLQNWWDISFAIRP